MAKRITNHRYSISTVRLERIFIAIVPTSFWKFLAACLPCFRFSDPLTGLRQWLVHLWISVADKKSKDSCVRYRSMADMSPLSFDPLSLLDMGQSSLFQTSNLS